MSSKALFKATEAKEFFHYLKMSLIKSFACRIKPAAAGRVTEPATAALCCSIKTSLSLEKKQQRAFTEALFNLIL